MQLTQVKVSAAGFTRKVTAHLAKYRKQLYLRNGKCYGFQIGNSLLLEDYRVVWLCIRCTVASHGTVWSSIYFQMNIDDFRHWLQEPLVPWCQKETPILGCRLEQGWPVTGMPRLHNLMLKCHANASNNTCWNLAENGLFTLCYLWELLQYVCVWATSYTTSSVRSWFTVGWP